MNMTTKLMNKLARRAMNDNKSTENKEADRVTEDFYSQLTEDVAVYKYSGSPTVAWERLAVKQHHERVTPMKPDAPIKPDMLRFVCVSDTHSRTGFPDMASIPAGDVLLHGGDFTMIGQPKEVHAFNEWLGTLPHPQKLVIAGNHDLTFERVTDWMCFGLHSHKVNQYLREHNVAHVREFLTNCTYLEDAETSVCGIRVYGSPWQPEFENWAFNLRRGQPCLDKWNKIPADVDVLMTHGPPIGHGDWTSSKVRAGCVELLHTIQKRVKPKYHVFGHIHEDPGMTTDGVTNYINASTCNLRYHPVQKPIVFDLPIPEGHSKQELSDVLRLISYADMEPGAMPHHLQEDEVKNACGPDDVAAASEAPEGADASWDTRTDWDKVENWGKAEREWDENASSPVDKLN